MGGAVMEGGAVAVDDGLAVWRGTGILVRFRVRVRVRLGLGLAMGRAS